MHHYPFAINALPTLLIATSLCSLGFAETAQAEKGDQEWIVSAGKGLGDALIQQKSIAGAGMVGANWSYQFYDYPGNHRIQWWAQGSYSFMQMHYDGRDQNQHIWELKPVMRWYPGTEAEGLFGELGIGAAYLTERSFGVIDLSTNLNFSLHFAGGYTLQTGQTISLRYSHFSNGYTNTPNPGFDFASINWHLAF
ncbi:acyloxyacyl hydrolase [Microbulbifer sp. SA54]|uniref:acyloxyacyl hydrolase n=1 Tax=Microbulbifer sp. SA54 TaxID=3401577 RepID=UPI003AAF1345